MGGLLDVRILLNNMTRLTDDLLWPSWLSPVALRHKTRMRCSFGRFSLTVSAVKSSQHACNVCPREAITDIQQRTVVGLRHVIGEAVAEVRPGGGAPLPHCP